MQASGNIVIFVCAWVAMATALAVCAGGCRQVETVAPDRSSISGDRPAAPPVAAASTSSAQVVAVCRVPADATDDSRFTVLAPCPSPGGRGETVAPVGYNRDDAGLLPAPCSPLPADLTEAAGTMEPLARGDGEQLPPSFGDAAKGLGELADESMEQSAGQPPSSAGYSRKPA